MIYVFVSTFFNRYFYVIYVVVSIFFNRSNIFLLLLENLCCPYSLALPQWDHSLPQQSNIKMWLLIRNAAKRQFITSQGNMEI